MVTRRIRLIENIQKRRVTFSKRLKGLIKKAKELSILCDAEIALIIYSCTNKVHEYSSHSMNQTLSRYGYISSLSGPTQQLPSQENEAELQNTESIKGEIQRLQIENERLKGEKLNGMSISDLISLETLLLNSLNSVKDQKTQIMINQVEQSRSQEKKALEENKILREQVEMLGRDSGTEVLSERPQISSPEPGNKELRSHTSLLLGSQPEEKETDGGIELR